MSTDGDLRFLDCVSNSSQSGVGRITGLDGNVLPFGDNGFWRIFNALRRPGFIRLRIISSITAADQGVMRLSSILDCISVIHR